MTPVNYRPTMRLTRIMLFVAGGLVLAVGFSLYLLTNQTERYFAWTVGSLLTAAFLGGSYWSTSVLEFLSARERLWVDSRPSIPAVAIFTFLTLMVTLIHIDKFHFDAVLFFFNGLGLLVAPAAVAPYWPWPLTALTGRAVGAWFVGLCVATGQAAWENDRQRVRAIMISLIAFSVLQIVALVRYGIELNWETPAAWLYVLLLVLLGTIGGYKTMKTRAISSEV